MRLEDFEEFKNEMRQLCAGYGRTLTNAIAQAYWRVLAGLPLEQLKRNITTLLVRATKDAKMPKPAELAAGWAGLQVPEAPGARNWRRDYWRGFMVDCLQKELCMRRKGVPGEPHLERYIAGRESVFGPLRLTLDRACELEALNEGQRTPGIYELIANDVHRVVDAHCGVVD